MKPTKALEGGLAGAVALTLVHEAVRRLMPSAPRMDLLGMTALARLLKGMNWSVPNDKKLYGWTLAGDIVANALYYSLAGVGNKKNVLLKSTLLGLVAGAGALVVPKITPLNEGFGGRTAKRGTLTVAWYLIGGLVAGGVMLALSNRKKKENSDYKEQVLTNPAEKNINGFVAS